MECAIEVDNLTKSYGTNQVLKGIYLHIGAGQIFALLGTNGAGKTTTLECIEGLRTYDGGQIQVNGTCGVQLQSASLPGNMKAKEAIRLFAGWQKKTVDEGYLERLGVTPFLDKKYIQLSTGQKRRLHLAIALLGEPDIIFLDEPTAGLDVEGRVSIHKEIRALKGKGKTIILASHDMAEVEELCDRIYILREGEIAFTGSPARLTEHKEGSSFTLKLRFSRDPDVSHTDVLKKAKKEQDYYILQTQNIADTLSDIISCVEAQNITIYHVKTEQAEMEQRFLSLANETKEKDGDC